MVMKLLKRTFVGLFLFLFAYLFVVYLWANATVDELLEQSPARGLAAQLPARHVEALLRVEDPAFLEHDGWDVSNGQGLTTITSVLARDLFLGKNEVEGFKGGMQSFYRGVFGCCKRIDFGRDVMALVLHARTTKQQQLDRYLDSAYLGSFNGRAVIGFEAAAMAYYGKELSRLTDAEFLGLVAMPIAPNRYHPLKNPELHAERVRRIAALVAGKCAPSGWLDQTYDACAAVDRPASTTTPSSSA